MDPQKKAGTRSPASGGEPNHAKVGDSREAAHAVGGKGDFGIDPGRAARLGTDSDEARRMRALSDEAKHRPAGDHLVDDRPGHSRGDGVRDTGVGGMASGPGSSSGGDVDTDVVGLGGAGLAQAAPTDAAGPDESTGTSDDFAAGPHAAGRHQDDVGKIGGSKRVPQAATLMPMGGDVTTNESTGGAAAATNVNNASGPDDASAGEVSADEAAGQGGV